MNEDEQNQEIAKQIFDSLPDEARRELMDLLDKAETADDFVSFVMTGPCPRCGNELTKDGESVAGNEGEGDPTVGICPDCDYMWCVECGQELKEGVECPHWDAWEEYCREQQIHQGPDAELDEEYNVDYEAWLEAYARSLSGEEVDGDDGSPGQ